MIGYQYAYVQAAASVLDESRAYARVGQKPFMKLSVNATFAAEVP